MADARIAVETGVDGVDVVIGTSSCRSSLCAADAALLIHLEVLQEHSHGKDMTYIQKV